LTLRLFLFGSWISLGFSFSTPSSPSIDSSKSVSMSSI
jgi:hypothetical protein